MLIGTAHLHQETWQQTLQKNLNESSELILRDAIVKFQQSNITEAIAPTLEDLRNFHFAALLEYPEYEGGTAGALLGLFFIRYNGFKDKDRSGMFGGTMIWADGTPAQDDFSPLFHTTFDPGMNKSNCYRFMTWSTKNRDFKIVAYECEQNIDFYNYLVGFSYPIEFPPKTEQKRYDHYTELKRNMIPEISHPRRCALGDHGWEGDDGEVHCFSIVHKRFNHMEPLYTVDDSICRAQREQKRIAMYPATFRNEEEYTAILAKMRDDLTTDRPVMHQHHYVLFGLWYFRGAGYRWSDFSQHSDFSYVDPAFDSSRNSSLCYRFLAAPFAEDYAIAMKCNKHIRLLSVLCMYKADEYHEDGRVPRISISKENDAFLVKMMDLQLLADSESIQNGAGCAGWWMSLVPTIVTMLYFLANLPASVVNNPSSI